MKKTTARLSGVQVESGNVVHVTFTDNRIVSVDLNGIIDNYAAFAPLSDAEEFATAAVADWGWSLEWRCGATLDADRVFELSLEQAGLLGNVAFRHWQDSNGLSLARAAEAIGLTRRTVSQFRTGARPVSKTVALACKGWEVEKRAA
jgi:hypothetical protein